MGNCEAASGDDKGQAAEGSNKEEAIEGEWQVICGKRYAEIER